MTNWTFKQKSDNDFMDSFSPEVKKYLGIKDGFPSGDPARWLLDSFQLISKDWSNSYGDYSFLVVPASKALEYWIFKIAEDLGVNTKTTDKVGVVIERMEKEVGKITSFQNEKEKEVIQRDINFLKNFVKEYRHNIVHCRKKIEGIGAAKNKIATIYEKINSITEKLINIEKIHRE